MKISKKATMGISLAIGTIMFATTAFAEVSSKSGYDQLKDAFKNTAESCSSKFQNYTINTSIVLKDNGKIIEEQDSVNKYDISKNVNENTSSSVEGTNAKVESYYYSDKDGYISYSSEDGIYHEIDYSGTKKTTPIFRNPFKEKGAGDIEKIADAVVGNLKDSVVVNQKADGSKELSGSISEAQIPAIANALVSYELKHVFASNNNPRNTNNKSTIPNITDDIYVKAVKGNLTLNKDGLIQSVIGTGILSGKDEQGKLHELTYEILGKLVDVNSTVVNKPDLSGKKVQKDQEVDNDSLSNPQMYVGTYKSDIIIKKDNKFQKIGEKIVDITSIDDKKISGRYHEEYVKGNEDYSKNAKDYKFDAAADKEQQNSFTFYITDAAGTKTSGHIFIDAYSAQINFSFEKSNYGNTLGNSQYSRVFN